MMTDILQIATPDDFKFRQTVYSHGWCSLAPFALDRDKWILRRVFDLDGGGAVAADISEDADAVSIVLGEAVNETDAAKIIRDVRHILRLDENFAAFYRLTDAFDEFKWVAARGAGRLLRSPTVWEDLVKSICTTNCSWALTKIMTTNLVEKLGTATAGGQKSFPSAARMAEKPESFYRDEIRAGYRAGYFAELSQRVAGGEIDVESWATTDLPVAELKKEMKRVKGVGDYAADNLLKLVGRYDGLALDSMLRGDFAKLHNNGERADDKQICAHYERFGEWRGLVIWLDATKDYFLD
jgi:N-glycosylase/DNA lyase